MPDDLEPIRQQMLADMYDTGGLTVELDDRLALAASALAGALAQAWPRSGKYHPNRLPTFMNIRVSEKRWPLKRYVVVPSPAMLVEKGHLTRGGKYLPGQGVALRTTLQMEPVMVRIIQDGQ